MCPETLCLGTFVLSGHAVKEKSFMCKLFLISTSIHKKRFLPTQRVFLNLLPCLLWLEFFSTTQFFF